MLFVRKRQKELFLFEKDGKESSRIYFFLLIKCIQQGAGSEP